MNQHISEAINQSIFNLFLHNRLLLKFSSIFYVLVIQRKVNKSPSTWDYFQFLMLTYFCLRISSPKTALGLTEFNASAWTDCTYLSLISFFWTKKPSILAQFQSGWYKHDQSNGCNCLGMCILNSIYWLWACRVLHDRLLCHSFSFLLWQIHRIVLHIPFRIILLQNGRQALTAM